MRLSTSKLAIATAFFLISSAGKAEEIWKDLTISAGMLSASYSENQPTLVGENLEIAASGSMSSISGFINYKFNPGLENSYYLTGVFPLTTGTTGSFFGGTLGAEYYFGKKMGSHLSLKDFSSTLKIKPRSLFFWGGEVGVGYLVYLTETAKKADMLFTLGPMVGGIYKLTDRWIFRYQVAYERGIGVTTTTSFMKFSIGLVYPIAD